MKVEVPIVGESEKNHKIVVIPKDAKTVPTDFSWQECVGSDHTFQVHRTDYCEQLKFAHDELGFKRVRCHGVFCDDMLTIQTFADFMPAPGLEKIRSVNFHQVGHAFDNILKCGMQPFVELSFMPKQLARGTHTGFHYGNIVEPPTDYSEWAEYVKEFIRFLLDRYGALEVEDWYFEIWNEPDLNPFFFTGTQEEYFKLYEVSARAIKEVDPALRVGGPSTSANRWTREFIDFCTKNGVPFDFVSTHHYPGDAFGNLPSEEEGGMEGLYSRKLAAIIGEGCDLEDANMKMFYDTEIQKRIPKGILTQQLLESREKVGDLPLFYTEWNSMSTNGAPVHDEKYSSAFVIKTVMDLCGAADVYSFWCVSDIFEETFFLQKPFNGAFGIQTIDGIPKPNFWAFKLLSKLAPKRLELPARTNEPVEYAAFTDGEKLQILVYAQDGRSWIDESHEVDILAEFGAKSAQVERIDDEHCNPKKMWVEMGSPKNLKPSEVDEIRRATRLASEALPFERDGDYTKLHLTLRTNDVALITLR